MNNPAPYLVEILFPLVPFPTFVDDPGGKPFTPRSSTRPRPLYRYLDARPPLRPRRYCAGTTKAP